jgi:hypothetical protein
VIRPRTDLIRHFDEVAVGITEIERTQRAARAGLVDRTELDLDRAVPQMRGDLIERRVRGEADVDRAGLRLPRLRLEFAPRLKGFNL